MRVEWIVTVSQETRQWANTRDARVSRVCARFFVSSVSRRNSRPHAVYVSVDHPECLPHIGAPTSGILKTLGLHVRFFPVLEAKTKKTLYIWVTILQTTNSVISISIHSFKYEYCKRFFELTNCHSFTSRWVSKFFANFEMMQIVFTTIRVTNIFYR